MSKTKFFGITIGVAGLIIAFAYKCYRLSQQLETVQSELAQKSAELDDINEVLNANPKLKECFKHPRKRKFLLRGGEYLPDYENPRTLNDKVVYLLENYFLRSPLQKVIGTKYLAKKYTEDVVGKQHVVRLLGVWDNPEDINWDDLPKSFVLKSVRGNYGREVIQIYDKTKINTAETQEKLRKFCSSPIMQNWGKNRIIAEELLPFENGVLRDYKFFCAYGKPFVAYCLEMKAEDGTTDVDRKTFSYYSIPDWKPLPVIATDHKPNNVPKPKHFNTMMKVCEKLSKHFPLVRIDLYESGDRVLVGEITEDASGGVSIMKPVDWDFKLGENAPVPSKEEIQKLIDEDKKLCQKYLE